jgi:hypothetical protein
MESKKCSKCGEVRPAGQFARCKVNKCGLSSWCKMCKHAAYVARREGVLRRMREDYHANIEEGRRRQREYRAANPEKSKEWERRKLEKHADKIRERNLDYHYRNREARIQGMRRYAEANRERIKQQRAAYRERNREILRERNRKWHRDNPEKSAAHSAKNTARRESRMANLPADFTGRDVSFGLGWWGHKCPVCGVGFGERKVWWDHWVPVCSASCPGTVPTNMVPLCEPCNRQKHGKAPAEHLTKRHGAEAAGAVLRRVEEFFLAARRSGGAP